MSNYDSDPMARAHADYWNEDPEAHWDNWVKQFALKPRSERVSDLKQADLWLDLDPKPTKEYAAMCARKRELERLHWQLNKLGR